MVKSADRVMEVLEWLAEIRRPVTHAQIAAQLGIPGSSTSALLSDIVRRGYLVVDEQRRYRVGPAVMHLAGAFLADLDLPRVVEPEVGGLASQVQESVGFAIRAGVEMLVLSRCNWPNQLTYMLELGDRAPLATSASGRAFLAAMPAEEWSALPGTVADAVEQAVRCGMAFSWQELIVGINTAAVAVLDATGRPVGALSISVPTPRYNPLTFRHHCTLLAAVGRHLSRRLGAASGVDVRLDEIVLEGEARPARKPARRRA
jgi:DNA-binding IclR family transcriptional regulator